MDLSEKDKLELEKRNEQPLSYHPPGMSSNWQYSDTNFSKLSVGVIPNGNPMAVCGEVVGPCCSTVSMVDSFGSAFSEHPTVNTAPLSFNEMNVHNSASSCDPLSVLQGVLFSPNMSMSGMLTHSLSQFPADSAFIERAARYSSFSGGHFGNILNPFSIHEPASPYQQGGITTRVPQDVLSGNTMNTVPARPAQKSEANMAKPSKDISLPSDRSHDEAKGVFMSGNDSEDAELSSGGVQEDGAPSSTEGLVSKKTRRGSQDVELDQANGVEQQSGEAEKNDTKVEQKGDQSSIPNSNKTNEKHGKQCSQASDPSKEGYIHVRARRGQATNSHSLAERVRREKISERMKFLQDLVPGCSKVTGKAVMLDEIINYVQSLQRQVEFLSMKLATVNPRVDFSIERLLTKDMFLPRAGLPSNLGFPPDMPMAYPSLHSIQSSILQPGLPAIGKSSDGLTRRINSQSTNMGGGFKEQNPQLPNVWNDELHNVVQMGLNSSAPLDKQETNCSQSPSQMKTEL